MKVILTTNIKNLGKIGELVKVKDEEGDTYNVATVRNGKIELIDANE